MAETVPFCERNIKLWLSALVVLALFVLGYAFLLAWDRGAVSGFAALETAPAPVQAPGPAAQAVAAGSLAPAALTGSGALAASGVALGGPADVITRATPGGSIQFIGGRQAESIQTSFNQAADVIRPTVVNVNAVRPGAPMQAALNANGPRFLDPFDGVPDKVIGRIAYDSVGSGLIVDPRGYVVTNNHVIAGATSIVVTRFREPQNYLQARIVATDTANDLALLQVLGDGPFPPASLADSSLVEVGDWVIAVGNPFGLEHTVTAGIISARRSSVSIDNVVFSGLLQTDAPINRGSSGGPLVNLQGKVIGVNTAIYAPTGVFNGTGFAIPSNRVSAFAARILGEPTAAAAVPVAMRPVGQPQAATPVAVQTYAAQVAGATPVALQQAAAVPAASTTTVDRGIWLGIGVVDLMPDMARKLAYPFAGGVFVNSVILDSPADEAQLTRGDVIAAVAGIPVGNTDALNQVFAHMVAGQPVEFSLWRGGKLETTRLTPRANRPLGR